MRPYRSALLVLLLAAVVGVSGFVLWFAHGQMLANRGAPSPRWALARLDQGVNFARTISDVYPSVPAPRRETNPGRPLSEERTAAAMREILKKGSDNEEPSVPAPAALPAGDGSNSPNGR